MTTSPAVRLTWDQARERLLAWTAEHGHAQVPQAWVGEDGFRLGKWVHNQRTAFRARGTHGTSPNARALSDARVEALEQVPGWQWKTSPAVKATPAVAARTDPAVAQPRPESTAVADAAESATEESAAHGEEGPTTGQVQPLTASETTEPTGLTGPVTERDPAPAPDGESPAGSPALTLEVAWVAASAPKQPEGPRAHPDSLVRRTARAAQPVIQACRTYLAGLVRTARAAVAARKG